MKTENVGASADGGRRSATGERRQANSGCNVNEDRNLPLAHIFFRVNILVRE